MTSFIHIEFSKEHPGVVRAERFIQTIKAYATYLGQERGISFLLQSAFSAALLVAINEAIDALTEGHELLAWTVMWLVAFVAIYYFAQAHLVSNLKTKWKNWKQARRISAAENELWSVALSDHRVMADLQSAISRSSDQ